MPLGRSTASTNVPLSIICRYLPPYSPDLNPIEKLWSKVKALLRKFKEVNKCKARNEIQELIQAQKNVERFFAEEKDTTEKILTC